jgi:ABC-type antimicrobial peptide transport system ATPase subunit
MKYFSRAAVWMLLLIFSCSKSKTPPGILKPEKMQAVFWDYIRADVFTNQFIKKDSAKNVELENARLQQQVFKLHNTTKETFYKSYEYYLNHQGLMKDMMDTMMVRQQKILIKRSDSAYRKIIN